MDRAAQMSEIDRNYDAFQRQLATYMKSHEHEYALMKNGQVVGFFPSAAKAAEEARRKFPDNIYSIQEVTSDPIDLGFFSHAGS